MSASERLVTTYVTGSAPAIRNRRAVSYSQLVPGNTGRNTLGAAEKDAGFTAGPAVNVTSAALPAAGAVTGYTPANVPEKAS